MKLLKRITKAVSGKSPVKRKAVKKKAAPKRQAANAAKRKTAKNVAKKASFKKKTIKKAAKKAVKKQAAKKTIKRKTVKKKSVKKAAAKRNPARPPRSKSKRSRHITQLTEHIQTRQLAEHEKTVVKPYPVLEGGDNQRVQLLLPLLKDLVKKSVISDWLINVNHQRSANLYVERDLQIEDELSAIREDVLLTIYERFSDGTIGEAQIPIIATTTAAVRKQIMEAKHTCAYARKPAFDLPQPQEGILFPETHDEDMFTSLFASEGHTLTHDLYGQVKAALSQEREIKANSFEILTSAGTVRVLNSNGVDVSYHKTSLYFEMVLTCRHGNVEREFGFNRTAVSPLQLDIRTIVTAQAQIARDATRAKQNPGFEGDVLLGDISVTEVFAPHHELSPLLMHTSAKMKHMGISRLEIGKPIGDFIGEPITISSNPTLPLGVLTAPIDFEGTPLKPVELIRNGSFAAYLATSRYGQYLNVPVTGHIANIQINTGATREQHLRGNDYFEIVSFSWFNPNSVSGDYSAEIRLGYRWKDGKKTPYYGGTFTGNLFKDILNIRLSKEIMQADEYYGPRAILFKNAKITRME